VIRLLVRLGKWLDARFPAKLTVTMADYLGLVKSLERLEVEQSMHIEKLDELKLNYNAAVDRIAHLEASAVHKGAVNDLLAHVKAQKDELNSLKASLGWNVSAQKADELRAVLNGEPIDHE